MFKHIKSHPCKPCYTRIPKPDLSRPGCASGAGFRPGL